MKPETRQRSDSAREEILARIRTANQKRSAVPTEGASAKEQSASTTDTLPDAVRNHLQSRRAHTLPSWPGMSDDTARLLKQMESVQITITRVQKQREVVQVVDEYRREQGIEGPLIVSPELEQAAGIDWPDGTLSGAARDALQKTGVHTGNSAADSAVEVTSVTPCFCAVAETGSIVTTTDAGRPSTLNFLPDNHVVVLHENQIVRHVDEVWQRVRETSSQLSDISTGVPRAVNFLTGPSRTADIEQTLELGAHGPKRMHVVLVAADASAGSAGNAGS